MEKFKKNRILIIVGVSLILLSGFSFYFKYQKEDKLQDSYHELIAMYVQNENGEYAASNAKAFPKEGYVLNLEKSTCKNGSTLSQDAVTKKINLKIQRNDQCSLYFDKEVPSLKEYYDKVTKKTEIPNFANPATTDETADGLFAMEDDYGTSYYFRGAVENNYLVFGRDSYNQEMLWRIVRFNSDGSARIQYDGYKIEATQKFLRTSAISTQAWNDEIYDAKYVGWMFGGAMEETSVSKEHAQRNEIDSAMKTAVDSWYKENIVDKGLDKYIADSIFCNDRSIPGKDKTKYEYDTGLGYAVNATGFGGLARLGSKWNMDVTEPTFKCPQENDKFTVEVENGGNGALTYPVGLITADEKMTGGSGKYNTTNEDYYLKKTRYWTMTPGYSMRYTGLVYMFAEDGHGLLYQLATGTGATANPVINIKAEYLNKFMGTGTLEDPYQLFVIDLLG